MHAEPLNPGQVAEWNEFCRRQPTAWFWHTTDWTDFMLAARPQDGARSLAFAVRDGQELLAIVPMALGGEGPELTLGGAPCWAPAVSAELGEARSQQTLRTALEHVDALAAEYEVTRTAFQLTPLTGSSAPFTVAAIRAGYMDTSRISQVLDLRPGSDALRRDLSKGHRAAVKRGLAQFSVEVLSGPDATDAALHEFRVLHETAAGRQTRPPETFDLMAGWARRGDGALLLIRDEGGTPIGGSYVSAFVGRAYYLASAMDRELSYLPIGHALQWAAIEWLIAAGVMDYELGLQQFGPLLHDVPSQKEINISRFKRGFGGRPRLASAFEKWYSATAFRDALERRVQAYAVALTSDGR